MKYDALGERMKGYENVTRTKLMRRCPVIIRIDGKAFHTFTRGFQKPFDSILVQTMQDTMKYLCENIQGCVLGYTQSDEISLVLVDYKNLQSCAWFDNNIQKMASVAASMATMKFNMAFADHVANHIQDLMCDDDDPHTEENEKYVSALCRACGHGATFDARVFNVPKEEVCNNILWRQNDAWIEAHKYAAPEELFNGEIGELHGVRFIEDAFAPVLGGEEYRSASDGVTYASFFFGKDAFGIIDPDGGALEMIIRDKDETDPPAEKTVIGYRFETNGATILYPERLLRVMSCSSFSNTDESNITTCEEKYIDSDEDAGNVKVYFERSEREDPNVFVGINGVNYLIPKGKASYIPPAVDREINRANRAGIVFNGLMDLLNNG